MFSKKQRIPREKIEEIFKKKVKGLQNQFFLVKKDKNNLDFSRFAVLISKKIEKSSVKRHQIKRRVISQIKNIKELPGFDYLIILKNNLKNLDHFEIRKNLADLIK